MDFIRSDRFFWRFYVGSAAVYMLLAILEASKSWWASGFMVGMAGVFALFAWLHHRRMVRIIVDRVTRKLEGRSDFETSREQLILEWNIARQTGRARITGTQTGRFTA